MPCPEVRIERSTRCVPANVAALRGKFTSEELRGLSEAQCTVVADPRDPRLVSQAVRWAAHQAEGGAVFSLRLPLRA